MLVKLIIFTLILQPDWSFSDGSAGKESACNAGDTGDAGSTPGWEDPLKEEIATHSSILA